MDTISPIAERKYASPAVLNDSTTRKLARHALFAMGFNTIIASVITIFGGKSFMENLIYSQWIGMSIWLLIDVVRHAVHPLGHLSAMQASLMTIIGGLTGYFFGSAMGDLTVGHAVLGGWKHAPQAMAGYLTLSLLAAALLVYFFMSRELLKAERACAEQARQQATEAQLKLLQSQLDPHMLFNTLANLRVLIEQEPERAVRMLDQLNDFLRATLAASRASEHSLKAEFDRLKDYLELMQVRMGARLSFSLELPPALAHVPVPALILQSLIENAIVHGLEPKVEGGHMTISAVQMGQQLVLTVSDNGLGFDAAQSHEGFGLTQVRERLQSRYGAQATIELIAHRADSTPADGPKGSQNMNPGCQVTLRLPMPA